MFLRRFGAFAFGAGAALAIAAGAACSQSYAASDTPPTDATPEASAGDAPVEAEIDADVADTFVPPVPAFTELATGLSELGGVAATETTVYFTEPTKGHVSSVPIAGGTITPIATAGGDVRPIAVGGTFLFWANVSGAALQQLDLTSGQLSTYGVPAGRQPAVLAAGTDRLVVAADATNDDELQQYTFVLSNGPASLSGSSAFTDVAVAGTDVYWTQSSAAQVTKGASGVLLNTPIATGETGCESIAANSAGAYWTRPTDGLVRTTSSNGNGTLTSGEVAPSSIVADETDVYWLTGDGKLRRKTLGQELPPATLAKGFASAFAGKRVHAIALTNKYVVWITTDGRLLRVAK
jgi:hypothetical protein